MRSRTSEKQLSEAIGDLYRIARLDEFPIVVMQVLRKLIASDITSYTEVNLPLGRIVGVMDVPVMDCNEASGRLKQFVHQHPIIQHIIRTGSSEAYQITDFISQRDFEKREVYNELYRLMDIRKQMAISIQNRIGSVVLGAVVNRFSRNFSRHDRDMLNLLGRHLSQAYENSVSFTRLQDVQEAQSVITSNTGMGMVVLDSSGGIVLQTDSASVLLENCGLRAVSRLQLPEIIRRWIRMILYTPLEQRSNVIPLLIPYANGAKILVCRYVGSPRPGRHVLMLQNDPSSLSVNALIAQGLTLREAEVLQWIASGKTNHDIAGILNISNRTVQKHVERILKKLKVETRSAAVARAREL